MLTGACWLATRRGVSRRTKSSIIAAITEGLSEDDFKVLSSLHDEPIPAPVSMDPGNDFYKNKLRILRDHGLIVTGDRLSLSKSSHVEITQLGRMVVEEALPSRSIDATAGLRPSSPGGGS